MVFIAVLAVLITSCISPFIPTVHAAANEKIVIDSSASEWTWNLISERKMFYANGYYWVFYWDADGKTVYRSSPNGDTWSDPVEIVEYQADFSVCSDGTRVYILYSNWDSPGGLYYRAGTLGSGTITWLANPQQIAVPRSDYYSELYITTAPDGKIWVSYIEAANSYELRVSCTNRSDGIWVAQPGFPMILVPNNGGASCSLHPVSDGRVVAVYINKSYAQRTCVRVWNGQEWSQEARFEDSFFSWGDLISAVAIDNKVYCIRKTADEMYQFGLITYDADTHEFNATQVADYTNRLYSNVYITKDTLNKLYAIWKGRYNKICYKVSEDKGGNWSDTVIWLQPSDTISKIVVPISCYSTLFIGIKNESNGINFLYTPIEMAPENHAPTFDSISVASQSQYAHKYFSVVAQVSDVDGVQDITEVRVNFTEFELYYIYNLGSFAVSWDAHGYVTLDELLCDDEITSTTITVTWRLMLDWSFPEGYVSAHGTVWDSSSETGEKSVSNLFYLENNIIVTGASVTDDWVNPGQSITFSAKVYYQGTNIVPEIKTGITGILKKGSQVVKTTTTIQSDGSFALQINAPTQYGEYEYTITAEIPTGPAASSPDSMTVRVDALVMDKIKIDIVNDTVAIRYLYARDSSPASGISSKYAGITEETNTTGWVVFDLSGASSVSYGSQAAIVSAPVNYVAQTLPITYNKIQYFVFIIRGDNRIYDTAWDGNIRQLIFKTEGTACIKTAGYGEPVKVLVNNAEYSNWQYDATNDTVIIYNIHSTVGIKWPSSGGGSGGGGGGIPSGGGDQPPEEGSEGDNGNGGGDESQTGGNGGTSSPWQFLTIGEFTSISGIVNLGLIVILIVLVISMIARRRK